MGVADVVVLLVAVPGPAVVLWQLRPEVMARRGRNAFVGLRTAATMRSDAAWDAGHEAAWPLVRGASVLALLLLAGSAVLAVLVDAASRPEWLVPLVVVVVLVAWAALLGAATVTAGRAARAGGRAGPGDP